MDVSYIVVDCADPERLAAFWADAMGVAVKSRWHQYVILAPSTDGAPSLAFQQVPEVKQVKNRVHIDFAPSDLEAETSRLVSLGAHVVDEITEDGVTSRIFNDPEGNEFCLIHSAPAPPE